MIKLRVEDYCQDCSEFEPEIHKENYMHECAYGFLEKVTKTKTDTYITCKHAQRCACIEECLEKVFKNVTK